jgi:hypothetical protein
MEMRKFSSYLALFFNFLGTILLAWALQIEPIINKEISPGFTATVKLGGLPAAVISGEHPYGLRLGWGLLAAGESGKNLGS